MELKNSNTPSNNIIRLNTLIDNIRLGVLILDGKNKILLVNQLFCDLFEISLSPDEMMRKDITFLMDLFRNQLSQHSTLNGLSKEYNDNIESLNGTVIKMNNGRVLEIDIIPINADHENIGYQWNVRDISEKHHTKSKLKHSEKKYLSIIENMQLGVVETDHWGKVFRVNDSFARMIGQDKEVILQAPLESFFFQENKDIFPVSAHEQENMNEVCLQRSEKEKFWAIMSVAPFKHPDEADHYLCIFIDITNQKDLEAQLINARDEAENARDAEQQFLAQMSHEIRTPLNAVIGMAHLLLETNPSKEQKAYLETLNNAANILHGLISDILDISKIESGAIEVRESKFDINHMIESIGQTFHLKTSDKNVDLIIEKDERLKNYLLGDEMLLTQVLLNLVSNAFKFTEQGEIRISVNKESSTGEDIPIKITVTDSGIGIKEDKLETIFESFRQADRDIGVKYGGTGLGLSITRKLIELLGGSIKVNSQEGKGTQFVLRFSFKDSGEVIEQKEDQRKQLTSDLVTASRILVVEDNKMNQNYIHSILGKEEVKIDFADEGHGGILKCKENEYDLILMDIRMPGLDGYETSKKIRNTFNLNQDTPIIALTASAMEVEKHKAMDAGMNDFLTKPFTPADFTALLSKYIGRDQSMNKTPADFRFSSTFDANKLEELYEGDIETIQLMFESFVNEVAQEFPTLLEEVKKENWKEVKDLSHKLLPTFAMVGLTRLHYDLRKVEELCKAEDFNDVPEKVQRIVKEIKDILPEVKQELERINRFLQQ